MVTKYEAIKKTRIRVGVGLGRLLDNDLTWEQCDPIKKYSCHLCKLVESCVACPAHSRYKKQGDMDACTVFCYATPYGRPVKFTDILACYGWLCEMEEFLK